MLGSGLLQQQGTMMLVLLGLLPTQGMRKTLVLDMKMILLESSLARPMMNLQ